MAGTISDYLLKNRDKTNIAIEYVKNRKWVTVSWKEYNRTVQEVAGALKSFGLETGEKVAIFSNTRYEWAVADMAALGLGAVVVPIYQSSRAEDIEYMVNDSQAKYIFIEDDALFKKWESISGNCPQVKSVIGMGFNSGGVTSWEEVLKIGEDYKGSHPNFYEEASAERTEDELATIVYTSGTTGKPKGVCLHHEQIISGVSEALRIVDVTEADKTLTFLPFAHILGRFEHWSQVYIGFTSAYAQSVESVRADLAVAKPTFLIAVPRIFEKIYGGMLSQAEVSPVKKKVFDWALSVGSKVSEAKIAKKSPSLQILLQYQLAKKLVFDKLAQKLGGRMRFAVSGGAPLSKEIGSFFHAANLLILEGYGLTETTAAVFVNNPYEYKFGTVGKAIGEVQLKFAADGEILIKSKKVMRGYYNNPEATAEVLKDGWFSTGDIGELVDGGFLKITDRKKDLIKTAGGKYVAPQKLENLLKLNRYVSNVLIHGDKKKYIVALLTMIPEEIEKFAKDNEITYTTLKDLCENPKVKDLFRDAVAETNSQLASYETIKNFSILADDFTIETGELTPSLKVKEKVCDQKFEGLINGLYGDSNFTRPS